MLWFMALLAVSVGFLLPLQAGVNASLRIALNSPVLAAMGNFTVGGLLVLAYAVFSRTAAPTASELARVPLWCWLGGVCGACLVFSGVLLSHRLGAATFTACILLGQLSASVVVDHFGLVGFAQHSINGPRLLGVGMMLGGALLILQF